MDNGIKAILIVEDKADPLLARLLLSLKEKEGKEFVVVTPEEALSMDLGSDVIGTLPEIKSSSIIKPYHKENTQIAKSGKQSRAERRAQERKNKKRKC